MLKLLRFKEKTRIVVIVFKHSVALSPSELFNVDHAIQQLEEEQSEQVVEILKRIPL